ncbi:T9SS type A sorting domain-containing protein, partial [Myroides sp. N17-2]|uniref:T9SS type A sorting domain-containing protein n=1 Tax=Myroides sp. N17-2 TaxID=2030799 RepID=UPI00117E4B97
DNYKALEINSTLTIGKAEITGVSFPKVIETYDGNAKTALVIGTLPAGVTAEYADNEYTDAGTYTAKVVLTGGKNYVDLPLTTSITIDKAIITGITYPSVTTTYDGTIHRVLILGSIPSDVSVSYEGNEGTNAGDYEAKAFLVGGKNYEDSILSSTLKINKADIIGVSFVDKVVIYNDQEQFIEITGTLPSGTTIEYEQSKQTEIGVYNAIARISGGVNYNDLVLEARFEIKEDRIPSKEAEIHEFVINGVTYKNPDEVVEHILEPSKEGDEAIVNISLLTDYSTTDVPTIFTVDTHKPNVYYQYVTVTSEDGKVSKTYTIKLIKPIVEKFVILQKFQNTLAVNNNSATNSGYKFVSYQWFRNGVLVSTNQSYSVGQSEKDKLNPNDNYYAILRASTGEEIYTTRIEIYEQGNREVKLYPNPVSSSDLTTNVMVDYSADQFSNGRVDILTVEGRFVYRQELSIGENRIVFPNQMNQGVYLAVIDINGRKQTIRFIVK